MSDLVDTATVDIFGVPFDRLSEGETVARIRHALRVNRRLWIATANVDYVMRARHNENFRHTLQGADLIVADGVPILWAARLLGEPLAGRVNGTDLVWHCAKLAAELQQTIALVGASPDIADQAARRMQAHAPGARVIAVPTPTPLDEHNSQAVLDCLAPIQAGILLVGLTTGKQEDWIARYWPATRVPVVIGVGGSFDLISGHLTRAPEWMQRNGLEWFYRLTQEPGRLWRRYLLTDMPFLGLCLRAALGRVFGRSRIKA